MSWIRDISRALEYIEENLTEEIGIEDVARQAHASGSHFQFLFYVALGIPVGEYIRNRRLSMAAGELLRSEGRVIDVALRYRYDTPESFSKAFSRFHGVPPTKITWENAKAFHPIWIDITIRGGFDMGNGFKEELHPLDWREIGGEGNALSNEEKFQRIADWALKARGHNPGVFDALTEWICDDAQWTPETLAENEQVLMHGVFGRLREQNARLRACLSELNASGVGNPSVFAALDRFDSELSGQPFDEGLKEPVARMFGDFSSMLDADLRAVIAGGKTGPSGTDTVKVFGYINILKECDAQVQWALFMPDMVRRQQDGFRMERFEYVRASAMRFIGMEGERFADPAARRELFRALDAMAEHRSDFPYDVLFMHHYGVGVDVGPWHGVWGRFMKANAPVPEGFLHFDFVPEDDLKAGPPYLSQYAFASFSGDTAAIHKREGYDSDAMYDVTRNTILGQGVAIPYPSKYWTAEVFLNGWDKDSSAYLFSVALPPLE